VLLEYPPSDGVDLCRLNLVSGNYGDCGNYSNCGNYGNFGNCGDCGNHGNYGKQGYGSCVSGGSTFSDLALSNGCVSCTGIMNVDWFSISSLCKISVCVCVCV